MISICIYQYVYNLFKYRMKYIKHTSIKHNIMITFLLLSCAHFCWPIHNTSFNVYSHTFLSKPASSAIWTTVTCLLDQTRPHGPAILKMYMQIDICVCTCWLMTSECERFFFPIPVRTSGRPYYFYNVFLLITVLHHGHLQTSHGLLVRVQG